MTILQIMLDDKNLEAIRRKAEAAGKSPEAWVADAAVALADAPEDKSWINQFLESARQTPGNSNGWKWNRDELYDR